MKLTLKAKNTPRRVLRTKKITVTYGYGKSAKDKRPKAFELPWADFVDHIMEATDADLYPSFTGHETKEQYDTKKTSLPYISAEFDGRRNNDGVMGRSILFLDLDKFSSRAFRDLLGELEYRGITYFAHTTTGDRHDLKDGERCYRVLVPTDRVMAADEIYPMQCKFAHLLGLWGAADRTAHERARIMFCPAPGCRTWDNDGDPVEVDHMLQIYDWMPPDESGSTNWTEEALANADENSRAIADWCFEEGFDTLPSNRGWAVPCPNGLSHSDGEDGTNGSTAIMLPDATHPEVRFVCQHAHCKEHNRHQHLMLGLVGVPSPYLPEAHNVSRKQLAELLPHLDEEDIAHIYESETEAAAEGLDAGTCTLEDLDDAPVNLFTKRDPIIEGLINFRSTWYAAGESNIGKSFYVLGQMAAVSAGIPFGGRPVIRAHSFYFDAEGGETSEYRKQALQKMYGDDLDWLHIIDLQKEGWDITSKSGRAAVTRLIRSVAGDDPVGLVAFDSLNQTVAMRADDKKPFDENSPTDMGEIVKALKHIAEHTGGSPGVIHHPAKGGTTRTPRGSSALHGAVDYAFFLEQPNPDEPLQLNLYHEKARYGVKQTPRGFVLGVCKIDVPKEHDDRIADRLSKLTGPDFSEHLGSLEPKPLHAAPRDETLWLIPVAVAPFETPAAMQAREAVKQAADHSGVAPKGSMQEALFATLELLDDRQEGYTLHELVRFDATNGSNQLRSGGRYSDALKKMVEQRILVHGRNQHGEVIATKYRIPVGINDLQEYEMKATHEDLE
jgi:hypothetical protein